MAYLKGKRVGNDTIDPAKHRFVGMFRSPSINALLSSSTGAYLLCDCGRVLQTKEEIYDHWQMGHFDEAIYEEYVPTTDAENYSCDNFGCAYCAGMGYTDYPSNTQPCPVSGHVERTQSNFNAVNIHMDSLKRKWSALDGPCPYCKKEEECEHWTGLGWTKQVSKIV